MFTHPELQNMIADASHRERLATIEPACRQAGRQSDPLAWLSARLLAWRRDRTDEVNVLNPRHQPSLVIDLGS